MKCERCGKTDATMVFKISKDKQIHCCIKCAEKVMDELGEKAREEKKLKKGV